AENDLVIVTFTNKGGQIKQVQLKKYRSQDSSLVKISGTRFDGISYTVNTGVNAKNETGELFFSKSDTSTSADGSRRIAFTLADSSGRSITHEFILHPHSYLIDFNIQLGGANQLLDKGNLNLTWNYAAVQQESDI